jgi:hypothetical protein
MEYINTMLVHRKIYDESLLDLVDKNMLDTDNGIDLFLTMADDRFIVKYYKDKITPILGYRINYPDGGCNYLALANYTNTKPFLEPYHNYIFDANLNIKQKINTFGPNYR